MYDKHAGGSPLFSANAGEPKAARLSPTEPSRAGPRILNVLSHPALIAALQAGTASSSAGGGTPSPGLGPQLGSVFKLQTILGEDRFKTLVSQIAGMTKTRDPTHRDKRGPTRDSEDPTVADPGITDELRRRLKAFDKTRAYTEGESLGGYLGYSADRDRRSDNVLLDAIHPGPDDPIGLDQLWAVIDAGARDILDAVEVEIGSANLSGASAPRSPSIALGPVIVGAAIVGLAILVAVIVYRELKDPAPPPEKWVPRGLGKLSVDPPIPSSADTGILAEVIRRVLEWRGFNTHGVGSDHKRDPGAEYRDPDYVEEIDTEWEANRFRGPSGDNFSPLFRNEDERAATFAGELIRPHDGDPVPVWLALASSPPISDILSAIARIEQESP